MAAVEKIDPRTKAVTRIISLQYPIPIKGADGIDAQIWQVEIKRLKVKHLKILPVSFLSDNESEEMPPEDIRLVILALTGLDEKSCDEIDLKDGRAIIEEARELLK